MSDDETPIGYRIAAGLSVLGDQLEQLMDAYWKARASLVNIAESAAEHAGHDLPPEQAQAAVVTGFGFDEVERQRLRIAAAMSSPFDDVIRAMGPHNPGSSDSG